MNLTDGIFSGGGDICELPEMMKLADDHSAYVVVDSSHEAVLTEHVDRKPRTALSGAVGVPPKRQVCRRRGAHLDAPRAMTTLLIRGFRVCRH